MRKPKGSPKYCLFGHVLDSSDPLFDVDSLKEICNPTYAEIYPYNTLKKPISLDPSTL